MTAQVVHKFRGTFDQKIDQKGRLSVPSAFRKVAELADPEYVAPPAKGQPGVPATITLVMADPAQRYLEGYTIEGMRMVDAQIDERSESDPLRAYLEEIYYGSATQLQIDGDGRIILPLALRQKLRLDSDTLFVGKGNYFELWNPALRESDMAAQHSDVRARFGNGVQPRMFLSGTPEATG